MASAARAITEAAIFSDRAGTLLPQQWRPHKIAPLDLYLSDTSQLFVSPFLLLPSLIGIPSHSTADERRRDTMLQRAESRALWELHLSDPVLMRSSFERLLRLNKSDRRPV